LCPLENLSAIVICQNGAGISLQNIFWRKAALQEYPCAERDVRNQGSDLPFWTERTLRVLHFFKTYWPDTFGGIERTIDTIADGVASRGVATTVLALSRKPADSPLLKGKYRIVQARENFQIASSGFSLGAFSALRKLAAEHDIVHYHSPWPSMDLSHLWVRHGKPSIVTYHADPLGNPILAHAYKPLLNAFLGSVDAIVATSPNYLDSSPVLNRFRNKTSVIPIGLPAFDHGGLTAESLERMRKAHGEGFFLFVGVLRRYKGIDVLLDAAKLTKVKILIAGAGPRLAEFQEKKMRKNIGNVHFLGNVSEEDKKALLALCRGFVFPSNTRAEAYGLSLIEASEAGRPMVTCELGTGTSFVNLANETGLVVEEGDPYALASAMNRLSEDTELAARLGKNARRRFDEHLGANQMVDRYLSLYGRLTGNSG
jgi:rhamnosyl/mannosyltransferase